MENQDQSQQPGLFKWAFGVAASVGLAGMLCCVAPMVLFMFGLMGGVYAISFANFFYQPDGAPGVGAWVLRFVAVLVGGFGFWMYRRQQNQCSIDPKRKQTNLMLVGGLIVVLGLGFFLSFEALSSWYFDTYIVPAQQQELNQK